MNRLVDNSSTLGVEDGWDSFYSVIGQADIILKNIDRAVEKGVDVTVVNGCKGEARFMRGLAYWYLMSVWGMFLLWKIRRYWHRIIWYMPISRKTYCNMQ